MSWYEWEHSECLFGERWKHGIYLLRARSIKDESMDCVTFWVLVSLARRLFCILMHLSLKSDQYVGVIISNVFFYENAYLL